MIILVLALTVGDVSYTAFDSWAECRVARDLANIPSAQCYSPETGRAEEVNEDSSR